MILAQEFVPKYGAIESINISAYGIHNRLIN